MADDMNETSTLGPDRAYALDDMVESNLFGEPTSTNYVAADAEASHNSRLTVSPEETLLQIPGSTTLTNFTTPSLYDGSPDTDLETSPFFQASNDFGSARHWPSLFPETSNNETTFAPYKENTNDGSLLQPLEMTRTESSSSMDFKTPVLSDEARQHRRSLIDGVSKGKRSSRSLAPIDVDNSDGAAAKRAKNTLAARKSRQKKRDIEDALRIELERMTRLKEYWMHKAIARGEPIPRPGEDPEV